MPVFPNHGGGDGGTWLTNVDRYVSPNGSDSNDGSSWVLAKKHIYNGYAALVSAGGGTLHVADNCEVGGPVTYQGVPQGLMIRGDGRTVPGFQQAVPFRYIGHGKAEGAGPFQPSPACRVIGGASRALPPLWIVATTVPITIEYFTPKVAHQTGARIGVDYMRAVGGDPLNIAVATAARTTTTTVLTLTLPTAISITSASRTSNVNTLTITNPGMAWCPFRPGVKIRVTSTNVNFASGDYTVISTGNALADNTTWTLTYAETAANIGATANIGSLKTHGCTAGDYVDLTSSDVHFVGTQYKLTAVTIDTLTYTDVFNSSGNSTQSNIGTVVRQERFLAGTSGVTINNSGFGIDQTDPLAGPSIDIGHTAAIQPSINDTWVTGYVGDGNGPFDQDRMATVFVDSGSAGSIGPPASALIMNNCTGTNGTVQFNVPSDGVGNFRIEGLLVESNFPLLGQPVARINGNGFTSAYGRDILNADNGQTAVSVELNSVLVSGTDFARCGFISGACLGGDLWTFPGTWNAGGNVRSPWAVGQVTMWTDGRITGKHPGVARSGGISSARFANKVEAYSAWVGGHLTKTTGQADPFGGTGAIKLVNSSVDFVAMRGLGADGNTWTAGGRLVVSGWINSTTEGDFIPDQLISVVGDAIVFDEPYPYPVPHNARGWQYVQAVFTVASTPSTGPSYYPALYLGTGCLVYAYGFTAVYVPSSVSASDAGEYAGTLKQQPTWLPPGMDGNFDGRILAGHGGFATNSANAKTAGVDPGQLTLTGTGTVYLPMYDLDGTTIIGWVPQLQATVNP